MGVRYDRGYRGRNENEGKEKGYSASWLHHKGRNKHHLEYWIDYTAEGDHTMGGMEMPPQYVAEMVCDRIAASQTYQGDSYQQNHPWIYYQNSKDHYILHPNTRAQMELLLAMLRDEGQQAMFDYIRKNLLLR